jgi:hypothetical protein
MQKKKILVMQCIKRVEKINAKNAIRDSVNAFENSVKRKSYVLRRSIERPSSSNSYKVVPPNQQNKRNKLPMQ